MINDSDDIKSYIKPILRLATESIVAIGMFYTGRFYENYSWAKNGFKMIPNANEVQVGYIAPSRFNMFCEDLNKDGQLETIIRIEPAKPASENSADPKEEPIAIKELCKKSDLNNCYLLTEVNGKPSFSEYHVEPMKIVQSR